jgi:outer membrane protein
MRKRVREYIGLWMVAGSIGILAAPGVAAEPAVPAVGGEQPAPPPPRGMSLKEAIGIVLERSPMSQVADAGLLAAEQGKKSVRGEFLPKLKTEFDYTRTDEVRDIEFAIDPNQPPMKFPAGTDQVLVSTTTLQQPLFTGLALLSKYGLADLEREGADVRRNEIRQDLILMTYESYFGILVAEKFVEVMEQAVTQLEAHAEVSRQFFENGMIPKNDLLKTLVSLAEARQRQIEAAHDLELAWVQFNTLLRIDPSAPHARLSEPLARKPYRRDPEECVETGLRQNPQILTAETNVRKAEKAVALARSGFFPHFALVGALGHEDGGFSDVGAELSATLHGEWTVWEWGSNYYDVQKNKAMVQVAEAERNRQRDLVRYQVREAYLKFKESDESIDVAQASIEQAEENYRITVEQYNENITTSTEVLDAQTLQAQARMNYYRALTSYNVAIARLEKSMGILGASEP